MVKTNKAATAKPRRHQASLFDFWSKPELSTDDMATSKKKNLRSTASQKETQSVRTRYHHLDDDTSSYADPSIDSMSFV
jgi:hypothetical protein